MKFFTNLAEKILILMNIYNYIQFYMRKIMKNNNNNDFLYIFIFYYIKLLKMLFF